MTEITLQGKSYPFKHNQDQGDVFDSYIDIIKTHTIKKGRIVDIGAHYGTMTLILNDNFNNTGIICFEAHSGNAKVLKENLQLNNLQAEVYECAIADYNGEGHLRVMEGGSPVYRLQADVDHIPVPVRTLDSFNLKGLSLIKVDIEGAELLMLKGAVETIKTNKPAIYLEHHWDLCDKEELYTFIESLNYEVVHLNGIGYIHGDTNQYLLLPKKTAK